MSPRPSPQGSVTDEDSGERWYVFGDDRLLSVTTAFRSIAKMGLLIWGATLAAEHAFVELPTVVTASRKKPCGNTHSRCRHLNEQDRCDRCPCAECRACVVKWLADRHFAESSRRADEGTRVHDVIEWWSIHGEIRPHDPDIVPYVAAFEAFVAEYGLRPESFLMAECTVINRADKYAGTSDGIIRFEATATHAAAKLVARVLRGRGEYSHIKTGAALVKAVIRNKRTVDLIVDWKSREAEGPKFYPEHPLQLAGYRWAPVMRIKGTEIEQPMPDTDGGVIIQLRPDGASVRLARCDEPAYEAFLHALGLYLWISEAGSKAIGAYAFPLDLKAEPAADKNDSDPLPPGYIDGTSPDLSEWSDDQDCCTTGSCAGEPHVTKTLAVAADPFALIGAARGAIDDDSIPF